MINHFFFFPHFSFPISILSIFHLTKHNIKLEALSTIFLPKIRLNYTFSS